MGAKPVLYRITAPVADFSGDVGGCHFTKGVYEGEVGDGPLAYFSQQGYLIEDLKTPRHKAAEAVRTDADIQAEIDARVAQGVAEGIEAYKAEQVAAEYEAMTNDELHAQLAARGLPVSGNKAELVTRLIEADQADKAAADAAADSGSNS